MPFLHNCAYFALIEEFVTYYWFFSLSDTMVGKTHSLKGLNFPQMPVCTFVDINKYI